MDNLKGKSLKSIALSPDRNLVTFMLLNGDTQAYRAVGDCCSHTWIEHLEVPDDIEGAIVLDIVENCIEVCLLCGRFHLPDKQAECVLNALHPTEKNDNSENHIKVYQTTIVTTRDRVDIEYRNSSNGYYGGYLEKEEKEEE